MAGKADHRRAISRPGCAPTASAWEGRDAAAAARLFSEDSEYYWTPLDPPQRGRAGVAAAWQGAVSQQQRHPLHVRDSRRERRQGHRCLARRFPAPAGRGQGPDRGRADGGFCGARPVQDVPRVVAQPPSRLEQPSPRIHAGAAPAAATSCPRGSSRGHRSRATCRHAAACRCGSARNGAAARRRSRTSVPRAASSGTQPFRRIRLRIEHVERRRRARLVQARTRLDGQAVAARQRPHAAILGRRIVDREPESDDALRFGPQIGVVGVADDFAADARLLEDVHRLQQQRLGHADILGDAPRVRACG